VEREPTLSPEEIAAVAAALRKDRHRRTVAACWLLIFRGARRNEILHAQWNQLDLERGIWSRPAWLMKGGKPDRMILSGVAVEIFRRLKAEAKRREPDVFPGKDHGLMSLRRLRDRMRAATGIDDVTIDDIRRPVGSWAVGNGVDIYTVSKMLGHSSVKVTDDRYGVLADSPRRAGIEPLRS
jgi:integrase